MEALIRYRELMCQLQALRRSNPAEEVPAEQEVVERMQALWPLLRRDEAVQAWREGNLVDRRMVA
jgi:hypothetical protein